MIPPASNPYLSIIIPCYNSSAILAENLPYLIDNLRKVEILFEIIIVDDGSTDSSSLKVTAEGYSAIYLAHKSNLGKGAALRTGFKEARGELQLFTDPDIPYTFESVLVILRTLSSGTSDLVIGNRLDPQSRYYSRIGWVRRLGSRVASAFLGTFITKGVYDTQCGIKGFTKNAARNIFYWSVINRFAIDIEIIYLAKLLRFRIEKIPVNFRCSGGDTVRILKDGMRLFWDILRIRYSYSDTKKIKRCA